MLYFLTTDEPGDDHTFKSDSRDEVMAFLKEAVLGGEDISHYKLFTVADSTYEQPQATIEVTLKGR